ncbi:flagellar assembly peptidoglycan hydrolase FlgJ [Sulfuriflexus sp.]|uniref:flagellar assembly peptidoglycan hydrolase FlgJ n=1 Tax=Sulfuriflexus sp. TaxID=2015443 RepID=UPI0028CCA89D|nr:flagellar assembly peptidoglycan hydrolase FlgJ [Sulfuriflexus sp.]MDT8404484.1 flagellar assembly peptidoglycan hydrolase FlgJ [Sulfuriflexus sp.]
MNTTDTTAVFNDLGSLNGLRARANGGDEQGALKAAAKQFEAIFLNMMLKQMREASFGDPLFDSSASDNYRKMFDQQLALNLSSTGSLGISQLIERQLGGQAPGQPGDGNPFKSFAFTAPQVNRSVEPLTATAATAKQAGFASPEEFVATIWPHAEKAARELGINAETLVSQAALETGWGKYTMSQADGRPSHNLFGIKADQRWDGERVSIQTTEYRDGVVQKERASFRAYDSLEAGFADYVHFLKNSPRYSGALQSQGDAGNYLHQLQQGGYATDPAYASKIQGIMQGETLQVARARLNI